MKDAIAELLDCCVAQEKREVLHVSLKNRIRSQDNPDDLKETLLREDVAGYPFYRMLLDQMDRIHGALRDPEIGYSPAQLVDRLPAFAVWGEEERCVAKAKMHMQFLREFEIDMREKRLSDVVDVFRRRINEFIAASSTDEQPRHIALDTAAGTLIMELRTLPQGIWLWPAA